MRDPKENGTWLRRAPPGGWLRRVSLILGSRGSEPGAVGEARGGDVATEAEDRDALPGSARQRTVPESGSLFCWK